MAKDHEHVDPYERDDGTQVSGYDRDFDRSSETDDEAPTDDFGPGGKLEGLNSIEDPEAWERATAGMDDDTREELEKRQIRDYTRRKQKVTSAKQKAQEAAFAGERKRRELLRYQASQDPHSKRILKISANLKAEPREPEQEGVVRAQDVEKLKDYRAKVASERADVYNEMMAKRTQLAKISRQTKAQGPIVEPQQRQGRLFSDPKGREGAHRLTNEELRAKRIQRQHDDLGLQVARYDQRLKQYDAQLEYFTNIAHTEKGVRAGRVRTGEEIRNHRNKVKEVQRKLSNAKNAKEAAELQKELSGLAATEGRTSVIDVPTPTARVQDVKDYNKLRRKHMTSIARGNEGLTGDDYDKYKALQDKVAGYDITIDANKDAKLPEETEGARIKDELPTIKSEFRPKYKDGARKGDTEDARGEIGRFGQEDPKLGLIKGWRSTYKFNREQLDRKFKALRTGEGTVGISKGQVVAPEGAKFTVGGNQELIVRDGWTPAKKEEAEKGFDSFSVDLKHKGLREEGFDDEGNYYTQYQNVRKTINDLGIQGLDVIPDPKGGGHKFHIFTHQGTHLNPDQVALVEQSLHANHGVEDFKPERQIDFLQKKKRVPIGYSKLPKDVDEDSAVAFRKNKYSSRFGSKFGERNPITRELEPDEQESLGVRVGPYALERHFKEDTDAIGWGTSWRPGSKEITGAVMALPRARRDRELMTAYESSLKGDDNQMNAFIAKQFPDAETQAEKDERKHQALIHGGELVAAATASSYYSAKKNIVPRTVNAAYAGLTRHFPAISRVTRESHNLEQDQPQGGLMKDMSWAYRRPLSNKIERAKFRVTHPLTSGAINPITGGLEVDPTVPGIMNHSQLNFPGIRYRKHFRISPGEYQGRKVERDVKRLKGILDTRQHVARTLAGEESAGRLKRRTALWQAKTMLHDVHRNSTVELERQVKDIKSIIESKLPHPGAIDPEFSLHGRGTSISQQPKYAKYLVDASDEIQDLLKRTGEGKGVEAHQDLDKLIRDYVARHPSPVPAIMRTGAKAGIGGAAVVGGSVLAIDRYQTYKHNKGERVNHPILNTIVPERIMVPKIKAQRTMEYVVPHNSVTDALDLQGEKIPLAGRVSVQMKKKAQLRNHIDVSGQPYQKDLPLLGGVKVTPPAKVKKESVVHKAPSSGLGPVKNMYMFGKKVPVDITLGRKERWQDKQHQLRASNNRYRLDQEDREHLVLLANQTPRYSASAGQREQMSSQAEQIRNFYASDERLQSMLDDPKEIQRIKNKNRYWLMGGKEQTPTSAEASGGEVGETVEEQAARRKAIRNERKNYRQWRKDEARKES